MVEPHWWLYRRVNYSSLAAYYCWTVDIVHNCVLLNAARFVIQWSNIVSGSRFLCIPHLCGRTLCADSWKRVLSFMVTRQYNRVLWFEGKIWFSQPTLCSDDTVCIKKGWQWGNFAVEWNQFVCFQIFELFGVWFLLYQFPDYSFRFLDEVTNNSFPVTKG